MRLIGREKLACFRGIGNDIEKWLCSWVAEVINAHWRHPRDVSEQFPNVKIKDEGTFLFSIGGGKIEIHLLVLFPQGIALIKDLLPSEDAHEH